MDKEEAATIIARELVKTNGQTFVIDSSHKKNLLEKALAYCSVGFEKPFTFELQIDFLCDSRHTLSRSKLEDVKEDYKKRLIQYCSNVRDANYVFVENSQSVSMSGKYSDVSCLSLMGNLSFFALIGEKEVKSLQKKFYKNVSPEIICAMDILDIAHFVREYAIYKNTDNFLEELDAVKAGKNLADFVSKHPFDKDGEISTSNLEAVMGDIGLLNNRFARLGLKSSVNTKDYRRSTSANYIHRKTLLQVVNEFNEKIDKELRLVHSSFFDFVFSLPYEDQNINSNKMILKISAENFDYTYLLVKEYSGGKYFQDYFDCLSHEQQSKIVSALNTVAERKLAHDSFLWTKGFRDIKPDYLEFYKNNSQKFIEYFSDRTMDEKKIILKDIMDLDFVNENITIWLNDGYLDLMREVGLNG